MMNYSYKYIDYTIVHLKWWRHGVAWGVIWLYMVSGGIEVGWPLWFSIWTQTTYVAVYGIAFYLTLLYASPQLHKNRMSFLLRNVWVSFLFIAMYCLCNRLIPEYETIDEGMPHYPISSDILEAITTYVLIWIPAYGSYHSRYAIALVRKTSEKAVELAQTQEKLIRQELQFYKSQFNAHLTFNTLSHIYDKVIEQEEAAQSVLLLSDILRYNTAAKVDRPVNLNTEINYLRNFIRIHQIIYPQLCIQLILEGDTQRFEVLPRILVSFVENAIKHGAGNDPNVPIVITLRAYEVLEFTVVNKVRASTKAESTQMGLDITRQTLDAFYGSEHMLKIEQQNDIYRVNLTISSSEEKSWALAS